MKKLMLIAVFVFAGYAATAQTDKEAYHAKVEQLVKMQSGTSATISNMLDRLGMQIPESKQDEFKAELNQIMAEIYKKTADIYIKVYNKEELAALLDFYNSNIGQKILKKRPEVTSKTMDISQQIGRQLMPLLRKYMR